MLNCSTHGAKTLHIGQFDGIEQSDGFGQFTIYNLTIAGGTILASTNSTTATCNCQIVNCNFVKKIGYDKI